MPYLLISTQIHKEVGLTLVGAEPSVPELMRHLGGLKEKSVGKQFYEYFISDPPHRVLDKLEHKGFHVLSMTEVSQMLVWGVHKDRLSHTEE
ncbi:GTP cyclohydrolase 1 feedback regulatory protein-like [Meles meles]|uniref:GTP cyclohydrolase 1 feedback regulatory protein-like n=1 Tax=Meles meles TaxID=9662 RepID=UPI001E69DF89|nr:GTP cyclohydrolase 1 feedback regulatory protein-like [Meles meles]